MKLKFELFEILIKNAFDVIVQVAEIKAKSTAKAITAGKSSRGFRSETAYKIAKVRH